MLVGLAFEPAQNTVPYMLFLVISRDASLTGCFCEFTVLKQDTMRKQEKKILMSTTSSQRNRGQDSKIIECVQLCGIHREIMFSDNHS